MAKKKATKKTGTKRKRPANVAIGQSAVVKSPSSSRAKKKKAKKTAAGRKPTKTKTALVPMDNAAATLIPQRKQASLIQWCNLYLGIEGRAGSDNTFQAKRRDLESFLGFLQRSAGTDHPDQWTRSVTRDFLKHLERNEDKSPSTINRVLATLRRCSTWIALQRPFLAGHPQETFISLIHGRLEQPMQVELF